MLCVNHARAVAGLMVVPDGLAHFPQLFVHKGQNSGGWCRKLEGYQLPLFEIEL